MFSINSALVRLLIFAAMWPFFVAPLHAQSVEGDEADFLEAMSAPETAGDVNRSEAVDLIVQQTNEFRQQQRLSKVEVNKELTKTAQYFADYMARTDRYGHYADGKRPSQRAQNHGYNYCLVSENIAYQYNSAGFSTSELAAQFVEGWKNSPQHRENMLEPAVRDIGVAVARSENTGHWYAVQMFGRPKSAAIEFKVANRSDTTVQYTVRDRTFTLPPKYARTHMRCRDVRVSFEFPEGEGQKKTIQPTSGDSFMIVRQNGQLDVQQQ